MSQFYLETPAGGVPTVMFDLPDTNQVAPDGDGVIFFTESAGIDITNTAANTINFAFDITEVGTIADTFISDSGSAQPSSNNLNIVGGEGIDTSGATDTITIAGEDASDTNKGIASFVSADFSVSSGAVSLVDTVVKSVSSDSGSATPSSHAFTIAGGSGIDTSGSGSTITVALTGGGTAVQSYTVDTNSPVTPNGSGVVTLTGSSIFTDGTTANQVDFNVQATANTFIYGGGANTNVSELGPLTNGQLIIGQTAGAPAAATLTEGTGIDITNGANSITIAFDITEVATIADTFSTDSGSAQPALNTLNIVGGEGIDTSGATDTVTISGEDASDTNKGIASFVSADFSVSSGAVSLADTVVKSVSSDSGSATPASHAFSIVGDNGISTSASGSTVTIDGSGVGGGGITWNEVTGTSQTAAVDNGYYTNNASLVTVTLPDTAAAGSVVRVAGKGAGGWRVAQNASEVIHFLDTDTTTGTGGRLDSTGQYDAVELLCIVADTEWSVISSMGNITVT